MLRVALAGLRTHALRTVLTALAVIVGGGMLGGSIIYGDTSKAAFFNDLARSVKGVDVAAQRAGRTAADPTAAIEAVRALPGVAHVDSRVVARLGLLGRGGRVITNGAQTGFAVSAPSWPGFAMADTVSGRLPAGPGETALDLPTATREGVAVGDRVRVLGPDARPVELVVVGLLDYGASAEFSDFSVVALTRADMAALTRTPVEVQLLVAASPGFSASSVDRLRAAVAAAVGPGYDVRTGDELRRDVAVASAKYVDGFLDTLVAASLVALVVAGLVVYNTFQILVIQRRRELALLRCIGASRTQLIQLVLIESTVVGGVASVGGALIAVVAGEALLVGRQVFGHALPDYSLTVSPLALVVPLVVGLVVTVASALPPAVQAGRVSPLHALQTATDLTPTSGARADGRSTGSRASLLAVLLGAGSLALGLVGVLLLNSGRNRGFGGLLPMVGGSMVIFVALVLAMPLLITRLTAPLRWALGRGFGPVGRLAVDNAARHPVRFAASATALMIGIAPLTTFAVLLTTAKGQVGRELAENFPVDFVLSHVDTAAGRTPVPAALLTRLRSTPELSSVVLARVAATPVGRVGAVEPGALGVQVAPEVVDGALGGLPPGTVAVHAGYARSHGLGVGSSLPVGRLWNARVVALYDDSAIPGEVLANWTDFTAHLAGDDYILIRRSEGTAAPDAAAAVDTAIADDPAAVVASVAERRDSLTDSLDKRLAQFDVLLGVSMAIALLGIANTLALSVLDRRRESATLRAIGLTRRQLSGMLLVEAVLMAVVGAVVGVAFGIGVGWVSAHELIAAYGHGAPDIPLAKIALYVGLAASAGALASLLPARRAMRTSVVSAMSD